jgi:hypothetical protein
MFWKEDVAMNIKNSIKLQLAGSSSKSIQYHLNISISQGSQSHLIKGTWRPSAND